MTSAKQVRKDIIAFITPFMTNERTRRAYVNSAFWGEPIATKIDFSGDAHTFSENLFDDIWREGGRSAIENLLNELSESTGVDNQNKIKSFIEQLKRISFPTAPPNADSASAAPSSGQQTVQTFNFHGTINADNFNTGNQTFDGDMNINDKDNDN